MSHKGVQVFLHGDEVIQLPGFKHESVPAGGGQIYDQYSLSPDIMVYHDSENWWIILDKLDEQIPQSVLGIVQGILFCEDFLPGPDRGGVGHYRPGDRWDVGTYHHGSAVAEIGKLEGGETGNELLLIIKAKKLGDALAIYKLSGGICTPADYAVGSGVG